MKVEWEDDDRCVVIANSTISNAMTFHWVESPDDKDLKEGDWALSACLFMQNDRKADPDPTLFEELANKGYTPVRESLEVESAKGKLPGKEVVVVF